MKGGNGYGVVGHRNQPNHVQMVGYYDRGQSKEGLEPPPVCQSVEGTIGRALERVGDVFRGMVDLYCGRILMADRQHKNRD
jgi:hypothetical protein